MTAKQQIEDIAKIVSTDCGECYTCEFEHNPSAKIRCIDYAIATNLYNAGYRKVDQDFAELLDEYERVSEGLVDAMELVHKIKAKRDALEQQLAETCKKMVKDYIFKVESYLGYNADNETFTKKELLLILAEVAKEQFGVEME